MSRYRRSALGLVLLATLAFGGGVYASPSGTGVALAVEEGCQSGGSGSESCTAPGDGCSVTCRTGYYACCNGSGATSACQCIRGTDIE